MWWDVVLEFIWRCLLWDVGHRWVMQQTVNVKLSVDFWVVVWGHATWLWAAAALG